MQPLVSAFTSTFSYDRAGLGWSQPLRSPPTLDQMLDDLHGVVMWAGGGEPVVLVGHSFGALLLLAYTQRSAKHVAGLVMLEPDFALDLVGGLRSQSTQITPRSRAIATWSVAGGVWCGACRAHAAAPWRAAMVAADWQACCRAGRGDARTADWRSEQAAAGIVADDCGALEPAAELPRDGRHAGCVACLRCGGGPSDAAGGDAGRYSLGWVCHSG